MSDMTTPSEPAPLNHSVTVAKIAGALALAQKNFAPIPKDREVEVRSERGNYKFKYATLDAIRSATMPALAEQGLAVIQGMIDHGSGYAIETKLLHSSGEWVRNVTPMFVSGRMKDGRQYPPTNQELGSAQSYARRYGLTALLCVTADEDDDGNTADGNHIAGTEKVPYKPRNGGHQNNALGDARRDIEAATGNGTSTYALNKEKKAPTNGNGKLTAAEKAKTWTDLAVQTLNTFDATPEALKDWWQENADKIEWLEANAADQHERFLTAWDNANESAKKAAA